MTNFDKQLLNEKRDRKISPAHNRGFEQFNFVEEC